MKSPVTHTARGQSLVCKRRWRLHNTSIRHTTLRYLGYSGPIISYYLYTSLHFSSLQRSSEYRRYIHGEIQEILQDLALGRGIR